GDQLRQCDMFYSCVDGGDGGRGFVGGHFICSLVGCSDRRPCPEGGAASGLRPCLVANSGCASGAATFAGNRLHGARHAWRKLGGRWFGARRGRSPKPFKTRIRAVSASSTIRAKEIGRAHV